jgi:SAM-dependent methyltransferase
LEENVSSAMNEKKWWDTFAGLVEQIWVYDEYLDNVVRARYRAELESFLYCSGGRVVDFGCGTCWPSLPLASRGMTLVGVDLSLTQLRRARQLAHAQGIDNIQLICADRIPAGMQSSADGVLIHALLHHLDHDQMRELLQDVARALRRGGRLYIYEPVGPVQRSHFSLTRLLEKAVGAIFWILDNLARMGCLYKPDIDRARKAGWSMRSPAESPVELDVLLRLLPACLVVRKIQYQHCWAMAFANLCMQLKVPWRRWIERGVHLFVLLDRLILGTPLRESLQVWPTVSILVEKL